MNTEKTKAKKKLSKSQLIIIIIAALFALTAVLTLLYDSGALAKIFSGKDKEDDPIFLFNPNYDFDIFEDEAYLDLNRSLYYSDDGVNFTYLTTENDYQNAGKTAIFFGEYFNSIIYGDSEKFNSFFTDDYYDDNDPKERFTMQMLHNMEALRLSATIINEGKADQATVYQFEVRYAIRRNNGTFRNDLESNVTRPQIYELIEYDYDGEIKINSISDIKYKN